MHKYRRGFRPVPCTQDEQWKKSPLPIRVHLHLGATLAEVSSSMVNSSSEPGRMLSRWTKIA